MGSASMWESFTHFNGYGYEPELIFRDWTRNDFDGRDFLDLRGKYCFNGALGEKPWFDVDAVDVTADDGSFDTDPTTGATFGSLILLLIAFTP